MLSIERIKEVIRYDANKLKVVVLPFIYLANWFYSRKSKTEYLSFLSSIFRLSWPGTYTLVLAAIKRHFIDQNTHKLRGEIFEDMLNNIEDLQRYKKFMDHPEKMLDGIMTVMAPHQGKHKGVIVIAYSYYFLIFLKTFDFSKIEKHYHIVLEPSWNGLCDQAILSFSYLQNPVFVMAYEERDFKFLQDLNTNIVPLKLSANWWIDPETFNHGVTPENRDIDIIMIAAWAKFKRHEMFFKTLKTLKSRNKHYKVTLVGYPNDLTQDDIKALARKYDVLDMLTFYEWIPVTDVAKLVGRAKVNIIWSRFEGLNRAIIEGMFCDTPCILRQGFNFGMQYPYINEQTGRYADESNLHQTLEFIIENSQAFAPRDYILNNHNCHIATQQLALAIKKHDENFIVESLLPKTSELNGMKYLNEEDHEKMSKDYIYLAQHIKAASMAEE